MDEFILVLFMEDNLNVHLVEDMVEHLVDPLPLFDIEERHPKSRNENYVEIIIPRYSDIQFFEHFRMTREQCEELVHIVGNHLENADNMAPLRKKLLFSVWLLSKQESFLATSDRFGFAVSTGHVIFKQIVMAIAGLLPHYIKWPNQENYNTIASSFQRRSRGVPGIIGAVDGCHIPCKQPIRNEIDYYNRKGFHSIILQGTCDHTGNFIDVFIGMPGRMHDSRVFRNSVLYNKIADNVNNLITEAFHILGDSAYPLMMNVMTPFRNNGHLTRNQTIYNFKHSSARSIIERSFKNKI